MYMLFINAAPGCGLGSSYASNIVCGSYYGLWASLYFDGSGYYQSTMIAQNSYVLVTSWNNSVINFNSPGFVAGHTYYYQIVKTV